MALKAPLISFHSFPDALGPESNSPEDIKKYVTEWGKAIEYEWFFRPENGGQCLYYDKRDKYHNLRLYARGEQSSDIYKQLLADGQEGFSYTNYDWRPIQILPKFVKLIVNQMAERLYSVKAEATDKYSTDLKDEYKKNLEKNMVSRGMLQDAKDELGIDLMPTDAQGIPETQEEVDLYMQLKYKPALEIAAEQAIQYTLDLNDYEKEIQPKILEDIVSIGISGAKHNTDPVKGITVDYVDPSDMVHSYPIHKNFKDVYYYGEVKRISLGELKRTAGDTFTDEEIKSFGKSASEWYSYHRISNQYFYREDDIDGMLVDVLHFNFKSTKTFVYKKKYNKNGGFKLIEKGLDFDKPDKDYKGYDVVRKTIDVWYKGSLILGTDKVYDWGLVDNMIRPEGHLNKTIPNYIVYAPQLYQNRSRSLVEMVVPYVDQMQQIHIKLQQLIAKSRPPGISIDIDGLQEIDLGNGNTLDPLELIKIYDQTGNVITTSMTVEGEFNHGKNPIQELGNGVVRGLGELITAYTHELNLIRDAIGIPAGADATLPHPDTLVGVQQQVALNSNTATRHILEAALSVTGRLASGISLRLKDIFKYQNLKEVYINAIGKINVEVLEAIKQYHLHDFGINIELRPDAQEKQYLEANIQAALTSGEITLDDAIDIRGISNTKLANQLLKIRRQQREKSRQEREERAIQLNAQANAEAAERTAAAKQQEMEAKKMADLEVQAAKDQGIVAKIMAEKEAKKELMALEFQYNMQLKGVEVQAQEAKVQRMEDEKTKRQDRNNTQASRMIDQRNRDSGPINFESSEDNISGNIELSEIGPS